MRAYSIFAKEGDFCDLRILRDNPLSCRPTADPEVVSRIVDVLANPSYKLGQFPLYGDLDFSDRFAMVKTGTSRNYRDTWAVGFTDRYLIGVWSGNKSGAESDRVGSVTGAGAIFARIVRELEPPGSVDTSAPAVGKTSPYFEITHPLDGSNFAIDPTSPDNVQSIGLRFSTNIPYDQADAFHNGHFVSEKSLPADPGEHTVTIRLKRNGVIIAEKTVGYSVR